MPPPHCPLTMHTSTHCGRNDVWFSTEFKGANADWGDVAEVAHATGESVDSRCGTMRWKSLSGLWGSRHLSMVAILSRAAVVFAPLYAYMSLTFLLSDKVSSSAIVGTSCMYVSAIFSMPTCRFAQPKFCQYPSVYGRPADSSQWLKDVLRMRLPPSSCTLPINVALAFSRAKFGELPIMALGQLCLMAIHILHMCCGP